MRVQNTVHKNLLVIKSRLIVFKIRLTYTVKWTWIFSPAWNLTLAPLSLFIFVISFINLPTNSLLVFLSSSLGILYAVGVLLFLILSHWQMFRRIWNFHKKHSQ